MAKKDLIKKVASNLNLTQDLVSKIYDETVSVISEELKADMKTNLPYIGTLTLTKTTPRKYTLPNGTVGKSKARKTVKFKPSRKLVKKI
jgi:nucleoid DNA-binding protein